MKFNSQAACEVVRGSAPNPFTQAMQAALSFQNPFEVNLYRNGVRIDCRCGLNGIVDVGMNSLLGVGFHADTQITAWYIGIIDNSGFTALAAADTMGSHTGWTEFTTYSEGTRQAWGPGAAASRSITNSSPATFSISGSGTVKGIFVTSSSTKSGTTGTLWATALFASNVTVQNGDSLKVTYTVSG